MTHFRNDSRGTRGILLKGGSYVFIAPGKTGSAPGHRIAGIPQGLVEVDPEADAELDPAPADLSKFDHDGNGEPGGSKPQEPPALSAMTKDELTAQAEAEGVDIAAIEGTGKDGNVLVDDIRAAIEAKRAAPAE